MNGIAYLAAIATLGAACALSPSVPQPSPSPAEKPAAQYRYALAEDDSDLAPITQQIRDRAKSLFTLNLYHGRVPCPRPAGPTSDATFAVGADAPTKPDGYCFMAGGMEWFADAYPFPASTTFANREDTGETLGWAPLTSVDGGAAGLTRLRELASTRTAFGCVDDQCSLVVHTYRPGAAVTAADDLSDTLSVCRVIKAGAAIGVPTQCHDIAFSVGSHVFLKAVVARVAQPKPSPRPTPARTPLPLSGGRSNASGVSPPAAQAPPDELLGDRDVAIIMRSGTVSDTDVKQTTCDVLKSKNIICGARAAVAVADVDSRFFTSRPEWFETFNVSILYEEQPFGTAGAYIVALKITDLMVSPRTADGFDRPATGLALLYHKNVVMLEKKALFGLCKRRNIVLGSDNDERPTVFECYR